MGKPRVPKRDEETVIEIRTLEKALKIPEKKSGKLRGLPLGGKAMRRLRREAVDCPASGETVSFLECFGCERFLRRTRGRVYCKGIME